MSATAVLEAAGTIVNKLQDAWKIIEAGAPSSNIDSKTSANAVPRVDDWESLTDSRGPRTLTFYEHYPYLYPLDDYVHVDFKIAIKWSYGARYKGGGAYIPNLYIEVPQLYVGWGWNVDIGLTVRNPENKSGYGDPPVAKLPITFSGTVSSKLESYTYQRGFVLYGDGSWEEG